MGHQVVDGVPVFGVPDLETIKQIKTVAESADQVVLMADHHVGYSMPIGGVAAYENQISPSGVGFDIGCGNLAVELAFPPDEARRRIGGIMDEIWNSISFGMGRKNKEQVDHPLFEDDQAWSIPVAAALKDSARQQLGTVGGGNHYVDLFISGSNTVWCGVHFGSRGLGHKIASHFLAAAGGQDGMFVPPTLIDVDSSLGQEYLACMHLAGRYAYAGREWVCNKVASILGAEIVRSVHNHHNFAWHETHGGRKLWVVRKGATPAFPGQLGFIGGSMAEPAVIVEGVDSEESETSLYSTVHGAGRVMSRNEAAGVHRWRRVDGFERKQLVQVREGKISREQMMDWVDGAGVELRGAGVDESPHCYKRLDEVLGYHGGTIRIIETLKPIGVAMAGPDVIDPYKD